MKFVYFSLILFLISSCEKERCYTIEGKEIINGEYYLLLENNSSFGDRNNYSNSNNSNTGLYTGIPDPFGTGKVDKDTYESVNIGEKYCQ